MHKPKKRNGTYLPKVDDLAPKSLDRRLLRRVFTNKLSLHYYYYYDDFSYTSNLATSCEADEKQDA